MISNTLDIDFTHGDIHGRSYKKFTYILYGCFFYTEESNGCVNKPWLNLTCINTLRPRQNVRHFAYDTFNAFFLNKMLESGLKFHWSLFLRFQLTIFHGVYNVVRLTLTSLYFQWIWVSTGTLMQRAFNDYNGAKNPDVNPFYVAIATCVFESGWIRTLTYRPSYLTTVLSLKCDFLKP